MQKVDDINNFVTKLRFKSHWSTGDVFDYFSGNYGTYKITDFLKFMEGFYLENLFEIEGKKGSNPYQLSVFFNQEHTTFRLVSSAHPSRYIEGRLFKECDEDDCLKFLRAGWFTLPDAVVNYDDSYEIYRRFRRELNTYGMNVEGFVWHDFLRGHLGENYREDEREVI